jgi:hypothetical protein
MIGSQLTGKNNAPCMSAGRLMGSKKKQAVIIFSSHIREAKRQPWESHATMAALTMCPII